LRFSALLGWVYYKKTKLLWGDVLEQKINKWKKWLYEDIHMDIENMMLENHIFVEVRELYNSSFEFSDSMFIQYLYLTYGKSASVAIRKQIVSYDKDPDDRNICLKKLLKDINRCENNELSMMKLNKSEVANDIITLNDMEFVKDFVDKRVAHRDGEILSKEAFPKYDEIVDCVIKISDIFERYYRIIIDCEPLIQFKVFKSGNHWKDIFKQPWIKVNE
jgi:hypothetical protein